jgi:hypothetical protein
MENVRDRDHPSCICPLGSLLLFCFNSREQNFRLYERFMDSFGRFWHSLGSDFQTVILDDLGASPRSYLFTKDNECSVRHTSPPSSSLQNTHDRRQEVNFLLAMKLIAKHLFENMASSKVSRPCKPSRIFFKFH